VSHWSNDGKEIHALFAVDPQEAKAKLKESLTKAPIAEDLLLIANSVYRGVFDYNASLEAAQTLIIHHPENWKGYALAAEDLLTLSRFSEAQSLINVGLRKHKDQIILLSIASTIYRVCGNRTQALEYSHRIRGQHPQDEEEFKRAAAILYHHAHFRRLKQLTRKAEEKYGRNETLQDWCHKVSLGQAAMADAKESDTIADIKSFLAESSLPVPIGDLCVAANLLRECAYRHYAMPFDWLFINPTVIKQMITSDFRDFLSAEYLRSYFPVRRCGHDLYNIPHMFNHHDPTREPDRSAFQRRVERFKSVLNDASSSAFFFHVRLHPKHDDLVDLLEVLPPDTKILSFVFLGNTGPERPTLESPHPQILQATFQCDAVNTLFARQGINPTGFTNGLDICCPYADTYARAIMDSIVHGKTVSTSHQNQNSVTTDLRLSISWYDRLKKKLRGANRRMAKILRP
jgi:hypothetical protein